MNCTDAEFNIEQSRLEDAITIERLRQRQQILVITVISPELHFDAAVGLCVEGSIREVRDERT